MKDNIKVYAFLFSLILILCFIINFISNNKNSKVTNDVVQKQEQVEEIKEEVQEIKVISTAFTEFNPNEKERTNNIKLAANAINGLILKPNEEFSFNNIVGERTSEKGYLPADVIVSYGSGTSTIKANGGGICQVSSTLCMAVLETNLEIVERNLHSRRVAYVTEDKEAMINWGTSDFRFLNTFDFNIKIEFKFESNGESERIICNILENN